MNTLREKAWPVTRKETRAQRTVCSAKNRSVFGADLTTLTSVCALTLTSTAGLRSRMSPQLQYGHVVRPCANHWATALSECARSRLHSHRQRTASSNTSFAVSGHTSPRRVANANSWVVEIGESPSAAGACGPVAIPADPVEACWFHEELSTSKYLYIHRVWRSSRRPSLAAVSTALRTSSGPPHFATSAAHLKPINAKLRLVVPDGLHSISLEAYVSHRARPSRLELDATSVSFSQTVSQFSLLPCTMVAPLRTFCLEEYVHVPHTSEPPHKFSFHQSPFW